MKPKTTRKKLAKAPAVANHQKPEITIDVDVIHKAVDDAIATLMAVQSLMHILIDALEEKK